MNESCIFCHIVTGKQKSYKVYEDESFLGFLDIFPRVKGHTLVIPKKHYQWVYDVPEFADYWKVVLKITRGIQKTFNPAFITYLTYGLEVSHAHIHILPRMNQQLETGVFPPPKQFSQEEMQFIAKNIYESTRS